MNLKDIYSYFPDCNRLLRISMEQHDLRRILPEMYLDDAPAICIYGITEAEVQACLEAYADEFDNITKRIKELAGTDEAWDVEIKAILVFDTLKTAKLFCDFANGLDAERFCEMIDEMQWQYNVPWKSAKLLDEQIIKEITG